MAESRHARRGGFDRVFSRFSSRMATWTGSHWAIAIVAVLVVVSLLVFGVVATNVGVSLITLLMVFVLQNTENRHSAALQLKLDEMVRVDPEARNEVLGAESRSEREIRGLVPEDDLTVDASAR